MTERQRPERNLALELVRVTESAALAAARWMGRGDKNGADGAAVAAMRASLGRRVARQRCNDAALSPATERRRPSRSSTTSASWAPEARGT